MTAVGDPREFDEWAGRYDANVQGRNGFPFGGYDLVLRRAVELAAAQPGSSVLDLGIGTGNLARHFVESGCTVWGIDFLPGMLAHAKARLPGVPLARADVLGSWPTEFRRRYDRVGARTRWADTWDEEHFWVADRETPACEKAGLRVRYEQVTDFAAVMVVEPSC